MKKITLAILFFTLVSFSSVKAQSFTVDTFKLNNAYRELIKSPNNLERQKAFFEAFPSTWKEYINLYDYVSKEGYDLTMYNLAYNHVKCLAENMTLIPESEYCSKIVCVSIGATYGADAPNYLQSLLHEVMWKKKDAMLKELSKLRKGYQMLFWQFYWSNSVESEEVEDEFNRFYKMNINTYPKQMEIMKVAYTYFYNGVNIHGGYYED